MFQLIQALSNAHRELLKAIASDGDEKTLGSVARKNEAALVACLKDYKVDQNVNAAVINSGSLKAAKMLPESIDPAPSFWNSSRFDAEFITAQPISYIREAQKRGFTICNQTRRTLLKRLASNEAASQTKAQEAFITQGEINTDMASYAINLIMGLDADSASRISPTVVKLLKAAVKTNPDHMQNILDTMFCIHDPSAADEMLFRTIGIFALLGVKAPSKDAIEHNDMITFAAAMFGRDGRKLLKTETGGLEAFIAGGHKSPPKIIRDMEAKRAGFHRSGRRLLA